MTRVAGENGFQFARGGAGTEAIVEDGSGDCNNDPKDCKTEQDENGATFHGLASMLMYAGCASQPRVNRWRCNHSTLLAQANLI